MPSKKQAKDGKTVIDTKVDIDNILADFTSSDRFVEHKRDDWDEKEKIAYAKIADEISEDETKSQIVDPVLSTFQLERSGRTTAQLPRGMAYALDKKDRGKNKLMNTIVEKWIYPNAKRQFPLQTKIRMLDWYSGIYGSMFGMVDWVVDKRSGYIGPELYLLNIRDVFPQVGMTSLNDSDYFFTSTLKTKDWLKSYRPEFYEKIKDKLENVKGKARGSMSSERISTRYSSFYQSSDGQSQKNPFIEIITRFERDKWIEFSPDFPKEVIRTIENPHKNLQGKPNGELPIIAKYCFPVLDDFFGLGEIERAESLQKSLNSLINLYMDGVKMSIFPPLQINPDEVVRSSIQQRAGAKWLVDRPNQSVQATAVSPQGINTFTNTYQFMLGAIQRSMGTSTTETSGTDDPTLGKTPQALKMQASREDTRDMMNRLQLEETIKDMMEKMINLQACKMETPLVLTLFKNDILDIAKEYPDVVEMFDSNERGKVTIQPEYLKAKYVYEIESGSTLRKDEEIELTNLDALVGKVTEGLQVSQDGRITSPLLMAMQQSDRPRTIDFSELINRWVVTAGINDPDKILIETDDGKDMTDDDIMGMAGQMDNELNNFEQSLYGEPTGDTPNI